LDGETMMTRFHSIYEKLNRVLVKAPFDELMISGDAKDEVNYVFPFRVRCTGLGPKLFGYLT